MAKLWPAVLFGVVVGVVLVSTAVAGPSATPVCVEGVNLPFSDLPGSPLAASNPEACASLCEAADECNVFTYHRPHCSDHGEHCTLSGGCCYLKRNETPGHTPRISSCTCSGYVRVPPSTYKPLRPPPKDPINVLYFLVDDLRPELEPYGQTYTHTPNIANLAAESMLFRNAYCQISVCSPSRQSFLTGRRPDHSRVWNFVDHFRHAECGIPKVGQYPKADRVVSKVSLQGCEWGSCGQSGQCCSLCTENASCTHWTFGENSMCTLYGGTPGPLDTSSSCHACISGLKGSFGEISKWTSLPGNFRANGYLTAQTGKVFHTEEGGVDNVDPATNGPGMPPNQDPRSWSDALIMPRVNDVAPMVGCRIGKNSDCPVNATMNGTVLDKSPQLCDKVIADDAILKLRLLAHNRRLTGQPFFLAVGFRKPHLAFRFPRPFLDLFPSVDKIAVAAHPTQDESVPTIAHHDAPPQANPFVAVDKPVAQQWRLYYMAAIAWMDSQLGRVMDELKAQNLTENTLIVLHSDHGWNLGEHGDWQKFTNWELGTRVPLLMRAPWLPQSLGKHTSVLAELIDVFPTMSSLARIPLPAGEVVDGKDLSPVLRDPDNATLAAALKPYALSQYMRCPPDTVNASNFWKKNNCLMTDRVQFPFMGYTLRTAEWRYTEWFRWNGETLSVHWNETVGVELYSHVGDTGEDFDGWENVNEAAHNPDVQHKLAKQLRDVVQHQPWKQQAHRHT
eukprot:m.173830 g.173830  ORF g.173830 m.173830 type:complete len:732 (-) comp17879_c0_seq2:80-2275(-)